MSGTTQLSGAERAEAVTLLAESRQLVVDLTKGLSANEWRRAPASVGWTAAEVVEHLVLSERAVLSLVKEDLAARPHVAVGKRTRIRDMAVILAVTNRDRRFQAAEIVRPTRAFPTPAAALEAFGQERDRTIAYLGDTGDDLRAHLAEHPVLGEIDAYQWLLFLGAHTERHAAQIQESLAAIRS